MLNRRFDIHPATTDPFEKMLLATLIHAVRDSSFTDGAAGPYYTVLVPNQSNPSERVSVTIALTHPLFVFDLSKPITDAFCKVAIRDYISTYNDQSVIAADVIQRFQVHTLDSPASGKTRPVYGVLKQPVLVLEDDELPHFIQYNYLHRFLIVANYPYPIEVATKDPAVPDCIMMVASKRSISHYLSRKTGQPKYMAGSVAPYIPTGGQGGIFCSQMKLFRNPRTNAIEAKPKNNATRLFKLFQNTRHASTKIVTEAKSYAEMEKQSTNRLYPGYNYRSFTHDPDSGIALAIFDLIPGQDLYSYFHNEIYPQNNFSGYHQQHPSIFTINERFQLAILAAHDLQRYHDAGFVYRDLKLDNIMVSHKATASASDSDIDHFQFIDFAFAKRVGGVDSWPRPCAGSRETASIEALDGRGTTTKSDIQSLLNIFERIWRFPLRPDNITVILVEGSSTPTIPMPSYSDDVIDIPNNDLNSVYKKQIYDLLCQMADIRPELRPTAGEIRDRLLVMYIEMYPERAQVFKQMLFQRGQLLTTDPTIAASASASASAAAADASEPMATLRPGF